MRDDTPIRVPGDGRYRVLLASGFDTTELGPGRYRLEAKVSDTGGNTSVSATVFTVERTRSRA